jgi:hypothetical protein
MPKLKSKKVLFNQYLCPMIKAVLNVQSITVVLHKNVTAGGRSRGPTIESFLKEAKKLLDPPAK